MSCSGSWRAFAFLATFAWSTNGCLLIESFSISTSDGAGGAGGATSAITSTGAGATGAGGDGTGAAGAGGNGTGGTGGEGATSSSSGGGGAGGGCACTNLVSAYLFEDAGNLGTDLVGNNNFTNVSGAPAQSSETPNGLPGHSISLDGSSSVCIDSGYTFDPASDHTLCWWARPAALGNETNQFAQTCSYDTWTQGGGDDYLWRTNNCNAGVAADLVVPSVYAVGQWAQICQTYTSAELKREVVIDGDTSQKTTRVDSSPIVDGGGDWCIGSFSGGGYWTGLIYRPMWFDKVLSDAEIQDVYASACCLL